MMLLISKPFLENNTHPIGLQCGCTVTVTTLAHPTAVAELNILSNPHHLKNMSQFFRTAGFEWLLVLKQPRLSNSNVPQDFTNGTVLQG